MCLIHRVFSHGSVSKVEGASDEVKGRLCLLTEDWAEAFTGCWKITPSPMGCALVDFSEKWTDLSTEFVKLHPGKTDEGSILICCFEECQIIFHGIMVRNMSILQFSEFRVKREKNRFSRMTAMFN